MAVVGVVVLEAAASVEAAVVLVGEEHQAHGNNYRYNRYCHAA